MNETIKEPVDFEAIHNEWKKQLDKDQENAHMIDYYNVKLGTPVEAGDIKRKSVQVTIDGDLKNNWYEFIEVYSGVPPSRGRGISSQMFELGMKAGMNLYTGAYSEEISQKVVQSLNSKVDIGRIVENLEDLIAEIKKYA